jgi:hypothetical protein
MPQKKHSSPQGEDGTQDWIESGEPPRGRPWAYEELLFGSAHERERMHELGAVIEELGAERTELARLHRELDGHLAKIARLERRLEDLTPETERDEGSRAPAKTLPDTHTISTEPGGSPQSLSQRSYSLSRCEGFRVDAPSGPVGYVEGLRFISRIDRPDLLEVRGGRLGRRLLLIPIEQVEEIRVDEARLVVRTAPDLADDVFGELVHRLRRALRFDQAAS